MSDLDNSLFIEMSDNPSIETRTLVGRTIVDHRLMTDEELLFEGWPLDGPRPDVLVLDDGTKLFGGADEDGKKPGVLLLVVPEETPEGVVHHKKLVLFGGDPD